MTDLRERQRALARRTIQEALVTLVTERSNLDFSIQEVADCAGVSLRTVYNHFPSRDALLDGLGEHFNQLFDEHGAVLIDQVDTFEQLLDAIRTNYRFFERFSDLCQAWTRIESPGAWIRDDYDHRTARIIELVGEEVPGLDHDNAQLVGVTVRQLISLRYWHDQTRRLGLSTEQATQATIWAVRAVTEQARAGHLPKEESP